MGKNIVRGEESRNKAVEIFKNGGTFEEASKQTGFKVDYVRQLCTAAGVYEPKYSKSPERREKALNLLKEGYCVEDVALKTKYKNVLSVINLARSNGIKPITKVNIEKEKRNKTIFSYRNQGKSYSEISRITGIDKTLIQSICRKNGLGETLIKNKSGTGVGEKRKCIECGKEFECSPGHNKKYCCTTCQRKSDFKISSAKRRANIVVIDHDITIKKLYSRDHGICHICGKLTDWNDYKIINNKKRSYRNYPSIDHIIPVSSGGVHSWGNVALAHLGCNARKGNNE